MSTAAVINEAAAPTRSRLPSWNLVGLVALGLTLGWAGFHAMAVQHEIADPHIKYVRVAHWQLEAGYREALQDAIDIYNRMHEADQVKVLQLPVTEKVYGQWLNVNLVAGNPPDIAEMGLGVREVSSPEAIARNFIPLGRELLAPNPYNRAEYLDEMDIADPAVKAEMVKRLQGPWRGTFLDGMRGAWNPTLQDFYGVPTSFFSIRVMANLDLLQQTTGSDHLPTTFDAFATTGDTVRAWGRAHGQAIEPVAAASYHLLWLDDTYRAAFTFPMQDRVDEDHNGEVTSIETYAALQSGRLPITDPGLTGWLQVMQRLCGLFDPNFAAMDRDQALARFLTGKAAFMFTGSWDAPTVFRSAKFRIGIMSYPMPAADGPWGALGTANGLSIGGNEASQSGGAILGVTKRAEHPEWALDFLRFLSSHKWNQRYNRRNGWLPVVVGTTPEERMRPFVLDPYGTSVNLLFTDGGDLETRLTAKRRQVCTGELSIPEFQQQAAALINDPGIGVDAVWARQYRSARDNQRTAERAISVLEFRDLAGLGADDTRERLREVEFDQALSDNGVSLIHLHRRLTGKPFPEVSP